MLKYILMTVIILACKPVFATPFEGSYFWSDMLRDCNPDYPYNREIKGDYLSSIEGHCELTKLEKN